MAVLLGELIGKVGGIILVQFATTSRWWMGLLALGKSEEEERYQGKEQGEQSSDDCSRGNMQARILICLFDRGEKVVEEVIASHD